jgi:hypothetical protein
MLRLLAQASYALPVGAARRAGLSALSALYNLHYLEGARDELGSWDALQQVLRASTTSTYEDSKTEVKERAA